MQGYGIDIKKALQKNKNIYNETSINGGFAMDVNSFCGMMQSEINALKARVYDITRTVEKIKDKKKKRQASQLAGLHALIDHLSELTRKLENECPLDWSKEREEIEEKKAELIEKIDIFDSEHLAGLVDN